MLKEQSKVVGGKTKKEGSKYGFEVDLDEHLSYLDEYKVKHRL